MGDPFIAGISECASRGATAVGELDVVLVAGERQSLGRQLGEARVKGGRAKRQVGGADADTENPFGSGPHPGVSTRERHGWR